MINVGDSRHWANAAVGEKGSVNSCYIRDPFGALSAEAATAAICSVNHAARIVMKSTIPMGCIDALRERLDGCCIVATESNVKPLVRTRCGFRGAMLDTRLGLAWLSHIIKRNERILLGHGHG